MEFSRSQNLTALELSNLMQEDDMNKKGKNLRSEIVPCWRSHHMMRLSISVADLPGATLIFHSYL